MQLSLVGQFHVSTPASASQLREAVIARLASALESEKAGAITCSQSTVRFRRGYGPERYSTNRLNLFDPGEVTIRAIDHNLVVTYRLGLSPTYIPLAVIMASFIGLAFIERSNRSIAMELVAILFIMFCGAILLAKFRVHRWLQFTTVSAIAAALGERGT